MRCEKKSGKPKPKMLSIRLDTLFNSDRVTIYGYKRNCLLFSLRKKDAQLRELCNICYLRMTSPPNKLNQCFHILWFSGLRLCLFFGHSTRACSVSSLGFSCPVFKQFLAHKSCAVENGRRKIRPNREKGEAKNIILIYSEQDKSCLVLSFL